MAEAAGRWQIDGQIGSRTVVDLWWNQVAAGAMELQGTAVGLAGVTSRRSGTSRWSIDGWQRWER
jgi:hypothetical protein